MPTAGSIGELPFFSGLSPTEIGDIESRMRRRESSRQEAPLRAHLVHQQPAHAGDDRPQQHHRVRRHPPRPQGRDDRLAATVDLLQSEIIRELQLTEDQTVVETKQRVGIYEVMRLNSVLRQLIVKGIPAEELHAAAVAGGMIDVKRYAALVLAEGLTSTEEVTSVIAMGD